MHCERDTHFRAATEVIGKSVTFVGDNEEVEIPVSVRAVVCVDLGVRIAVAIGTTRFARRCGASGTIIHEDRGQMNTRD